MKPQVFVMVGLPRSGKTTLVRQVAEESGGGIPILSGDTIRLALHGQRFVASAEPMVRAIQQVALKALILSGSPVVFIDDCNITREQRRRWVSPDWDTCYIIISTPKEECIRRARAENDEVLIPVIESMAASFERVKVGEETGNVILVQYRGEAEEVADAI